MRVEADGQRQVGADDGADAAQQFALGVGETVDDGGAVQVEVDAVEGGFVEGDGEGGADAGGDTLERLVLDRAGGVGEAPGERDQVDAGLFSDGDGAGERDGAWAHGVDQGGAGVERGQAAGLEEVRVGRGPGAKEWLSCRKPPTAMRAATIAFWPHSLRRQYPL